MAILKDCVNSVGFDDVWAVLMSAYDDIGSFQEEYNKIFQVMQKTQPEENRQQMTIHLKMASDEWGQDDEEYLQVFGYIPGDDEGYAVGVKPMAHLLGFDISEDSLRSYSTATIVAYCMVELTYYSSAAHSLWGAEFESLGGGLMASSSCMENDSNSMSIDALRSQMGIKGEEEKDNRFPFKV